MTKNLFRSLKLPDQFVKNTLGLYLESFTSYLFPLITLPYVVRVLGAHGFGVVAFAQSFVGYLNLLVDFALSFSGTRALAASRDNPRTVGEFVSNALALRLALACLFLPPVFVLCWHVRAFREAFWAIGMLYSTTFATALTTTWIFMAFESMWFLARLNVIINLAVIGAIFSFVRGPDDVNAYAAIIAAGPVVGSLASLVLVFWRFNLPFVRPTLKGVIATARQGAALWFSQVAIALYTTANSFLLGVLANKEAVAYFAAGEKVIRGIQRLISPVTMAIFPRMIRAAQGSSMELAARARKLFWAYGLGGGFLALSLSLSTPWLVTWFFGPNFRPAVPVLRILSTLLVLVALSNVAGFHVLLPAGRDRAFTAITVTAALMNVLFASLFVPRWQAQGMAWSAMMSELFVTTAMVLGTRNVWRR